jgi:uncharacterized protein (TIGR02391 family)
MPLMSEILPPVETLLQLQPEELAVPLLEILCRFEDNPGSGHLNRHNLLSSNNSEEYCERPRWDDVAKALAEAWIWLEREGLIAPRPDETRDWVFVTRRGKQFRTQSDPRQFKATQLLPAETLDPTLAAKVRPPFLRSDFESAVFEAFKEVEIRVRNIGGFTSDDLGVQLMRKAFKPESGPLSDPGQPPAEQQAISDLFAGAIGSFKNPGSHRDVKFDDAIEAMQLIMFADRLIRIAEKRKR